MNQNAAFGGCRQGRAALSSRHTPCAGTAFSKCRAHGVSGLLCGLPKDFVRKLRQLADADFADCGPGDDGDRVAAVAVLAAEDPELADGEDFGVELGGDDLSFGQEDFQLGVVPLAVPQPANDVAEGMNA